MYNEEAGKVGWSDQDVGDFGEEAEFPSSKPPGRLPVREFWNLI